MTDSNSQRRGRRLALIGFVLACAASVWVYWSQFSTYHLAMVQEGVLYRDGNRGIREFSNAIAKSKAKTVVCLIDERELADTRKRQFRMELDELPRHEVKIERVPVTLGGWPTTADVQAFLSAVEKKENQPVLVHCAQGVRRTGMMVAAYQMSVLGWDKKKATDAILTFGHSEKTVGDVKTFIDIYDPGTRTVTKEMGQSEE